MESAGTRTPGGLEKSDKEEARGFDSLRVTEAARSPGKDAEAS